MTSHSHYVTQPLNGRHRSECRTPLGSRKCIGRLPHITQQTCPPFVLNTYHIIQETRTMVASLKELKKRMSSSPSGPSFRRATPKTIAKTTRPRMFIPSTSQTSFRKEQRCGERERQPISTAIEYPTQPSGAGTSQSWLFLFLSALPYKLSSS